MLLAGNVNVWKEKARESGIYLTPITQVCLCPNEKIPQVSVVSVADPGLPTCKCSHSKYS